MFSVQHDPKRDPSTGQYWVQLTDFARDQDGGTQFDSSRVNRLGYWCDKNHLEHFATEILKHFNSELAAFVVKGK